MKTFPLLVMLFGLALAAGAQTNSNPYVPRADDMRIVEGRMYNRVLSTNWTTLPSAGMTMEVLDAVPEGVVFQSRRKDGATPGATNGKLLVKHLPNERALKKGAIMTASVRALPVAGFNYGAETVAAYDCGVANNAANRKSLKTNELQQVKP
jgi:hypothetical protein